MLCGRALNTLHGLSQRCPAVRIFLQFVALGTGYNLPNYDTASGPPSGLIKVVFVLLNPEHTCVLQKDLAHLKDCGPSEHCFGDMASGMQLRSWGCTKQSPEGRPRVS